MAPSKSQAQHNMMEMVAHDPKAAKRVGIPQSVGKDFATADKGKKFATKHVADALRKHKHKEPDAVEPDSDTDD
jgi:hypothetical protein